MSEIITSAKNPVVKNIKKLLTSARQRRQQGLAVAEGAHLADSLLKTDTVVRQVVYAESALENPEVSQLAKALGRFDSMVLKDGLFESISSIHANVGLLVVFEPKKPEPSKQLSDDALLLEDIQDPGNLGTILRTAAAAGIGSVYLSPDCASVWSPKVLRAGMGAQFELAVYHDVDLYSLITSSRVDVLATDLSAEQTIYQLDLNAPTAWLFGNEGQGVSAKLLEVCTKRVIIPQAGAAVESLNVSAAVAVCLFEQQRQRQL